MQYAVSDQQRTEKRSDRTIDEVYCTEDTQLHPDVIYLQASCRSTAVRINASLVYVLSTHSFTHSLTCTKQHNSSFQLLIRLSLSLFLVELISNCLPSDVQGMTLIASTFHVTDSFCTDVS